jgi:hypothetical protein
MKLVVIWASNNEGGYELGQEVAEYGFPKSSKLLSKDFKWHKMQILTS